jgi:hypothetical protein
MHEQSCVPFFRKNIYTETNNISLMIRLWRCLITFKPVGDIMMKDILSIEMSKHKAKYYICQTENAIFYYRIGMKRECMSSNLNYPLNWECFCIKFTSNYQVILKDQKFRPISHWPFIRLIQIWVKCTCFIMATLLHALNLIFYPNTSLFP